MDRSQRLTRRQLIALDGLAAAVYSLLLLPPAALSADVPAWLAVPLVAAVGAPVAARRVWPVPVFLVVLAASVGAWAAGALLDPFLAAAFALYPVALGARRALVPTAVVGGVAGVVLFGGAVAGTPYGAWRGFGIAALGAGLLAASWTAGRMVRERHADAARSAAELAGRAVAEERLRIARELHDVVAHSMSLIAVKAGTANHVMAIRPGEAQDALRIIETTSRTALAEMRQLLGVLRYDADPATPLPHGPAPPGPAPPPSGTADVVALGHLSDPSRPGPSVPGPVGPVPIGPGRSGSVPIGSTSSDSELNGSGPARSGSEAVESGASGLAASGLDASGLGASRLAASGLGASGLGASRLAAPGLAASGLGASGLGASGLGGAGLGGSWQGVFGLGPPALAPAPGVAGLPALAERAGQAGVPVELEVRGVERLPEGVALSVYRIVQEALTNVVRHAAPARCTVSVVGGGGEVRVEVTDDGPGVRVLPAAGRTGHGLIGMRERVLMYGGEFQAGPRPAGGFGVSARIRFEP